MSLNHASKHLRELGKKVFAKKHVSIGRIMDRWEDIMGTNLAKRSSPMSMSYRKNGKDQSITAQLSIQIASADALELSMNEPVILERINQILGSPKVTKLKAVHSNYTANKKHKYKAPKQNVHFEPKQLEKALSAIDDPEMRQRLESLADSMQNQTTKH